MRKLNKNRKMLEILYVRVFLYGKRQKVSSQMPYYGDGVEYELELCNVSLCEGLGFVFYLFFFSSASLMYYFNIADTTR